MYGIKNVHLAFNTSSASFMLRSRVPSVHQHVWRITRIHSLVGVRNLAFILRVVLKIALHLPACVASHTFCSSCPIHISFLKSFNQAQILSASMIKTLGTLDLLPLHLRCLRA